MHLQHPAILVCLFLVENETKVNIEIIAGKLKSSWSFPRSSTLLSRIMYKRPLI